MTKSLDEILDEYTGRKVAEAKAAEELAKRHKENQLATVELMTLKIVPALKGIVARVESAGHQVELENKLREHFPTFTLALTPISIGSTLSASVASKLTFDCLPDGSLKLRSKVFATYGHFTPGFDGSTIDPTKKSEADVLEWSAGHIMSFIEAVFAAG